MGIGHPFEALHADVGRNWEMDGLDGRAGVDARGDRTHGGAELGRAFIEREMRRRPARIFGGPG
jgi:hypothetical protein